MKFKMLTTAGAAAAMALAPVAAQAAPTLMAVQATTQMADEDDGGLDTGAQVAIVFFLVVVAIAIFATGDGSPVSP